MVARRQFITDPQLVRDVQRSLREQQALAAITPRVLAEAAAVTPNDVRDAVRYWERANAGTEVANILGATEG